MLTRLVALVLAVLLLPLAALASGERPADAARAQAVQAACEAGRGQPPAGDESSATAAACAAPDAQPDSDNPVEAMTLGASALPRPALRHERAEAPMHGAPAPWLAGLLRPPRALRG